MENWFNPFKIIFYLLNFLIVMSIFFLVFSKNGLIKNDSLKLKISKIDKESSTLKTTIKNFQKRIEQFNNNPSFRKYVIHKEMGYIENNEKIFIFDK